MSAVGVGFLQWALGIPAIVYLAAGAITLIAVGAAFRIFPTAKGLYIALALYGLLALSVTWLAYRQSQKYDVLYQGIRPASDPIRLDPGTARVLSAMTMEVAFDNPNDFDLWERSHRRYVSIAKQDSGDEGEDASTSFPAHAKDLRVSDDPIVFINPITLPAKGAMDFAVCFARDKEGKDFDKEFRMKGTFNVWIDDASGLVQIGTFVPAAPKEKNFGFFKGCTR